MPAIFANAWHAHLAKPHLDLVGDDRAEDHVFAAEVFELSKSQPVAITSARDKMPFEVTPFFPRLSRIGAASNGSTTAASNANPAN